MLEKNVPFLRYRLRRGNRQKKENLCIWQKSDRRSFSNESGELLEAGIFGKMNPVDLLIVGEKF